MPFAALLALTAVAHSQDFFAEVGPPVQLPTSGNWVRALPSEDGWHLGIATGKGYGLIPMSSTGSGPSDWTVAEADRWWLVEQDDLADHNLKRCPDGSWLHIATGETSIRDDSAWWFRHDADWNNVSQGIVEVDTTERHHSDPSVMCSPLGEGVLFAPKASDGGIGVFFEVGASGDAVEGPTVSKEPVPTGAALFTDVFTDQIHRIGVDGPAGNLIHVVYDADWNELDRWMDNPLPDPYLACWPQGTMVLGDYTLLATLGNTDPSGGGNRARPFLVVYDADWNAVEVLDLGDLGVPVDGSGRPWINRRDDLLIYTFDNSLKPYIAGIRLNLSAFGVAPGAVDSGLRPQDFTGDAGSTDTGEDADDKGCGCTASGGLGSLGLGWTALLFAAGRRRLSGATAAD